MTDRVPTARPAPDLPGLTAARDHYAQASLAANTRRAYRADIAHFSQWCTEVRLTPMPASPETVAAYLAAFAALYNPTTLQHRLRAIGQMHALAGVTFDTRAAVVRHTLRGIKREHGMPARQSAALTTDDVLAMADTCHLHRLEGVRDRALILIGFAGAFRRSELVAIDVEHLSFGPRALRILLPRSKGDAEGEGIEVIIPRGHAKATCPYTALQRWLEASHTALGPVFRGIHRLGTISHNRLSGEAVRLILRRAATRAHIEVAAHERLSPHGLRAGFITEAYRRGAREEEIMAHVRHKSWGTTRKYIRRSGKLADHPGLLLGL